MAPAGPPCLRQWSRAPSALRSPAGPGGETKSKGDARGERRRRRRRSSPHRRDRTVRTEEGPFAGGHTGRGSRALVAGPIV
jgi:hypothetical protein